MTDHDGNDIPSAPRPFVRRRRGLLGIEAGDVDRGLFAAVFVMVLLVIGALGYLVYAAIARPVAPRTEVERRIYFYEQGVKAQPDSAEVWKSYARALIDGGQYSKAADAIADGLRLLDQKAPLLVERARLEHLQGKDDAAIESADEAIAAVAEFREAFVKEAERKGLGAPLAASPELVEAELLKAQILAERGKLQDAVSAYTRALLEQPRMSNVLSMRGDLHMELGDREAARKDYREALRYDPEDAAARQGLKKLGD